MFNAEKMLEALYRQLADQYGMELQALQIKGGTDEKATAFTVDDPHAVAS